MMDRNRLNEIRVQRFAFLRSVYDETYGTTERMVQLTDIGAKVGFDEDLTERIVAYLIDEGLLEWGAMGGLIELTHWGLKEVEEVLSAPDRCRERAQRGHDDPFPDPTGNDGFDSDARGRRRGCAA
jgi:hypothetical protein